jgi:pyruvate formate lyase activating enzyme
MDETRHIEWTGVSNQGILSNLRRLSEWGHEIIVRAPIIPGINDDKENLNAMGEFLAALPHVPPVQLLAYHNIAEAKYAGLGMDYDLDGIHPPGPERMANVARTLRSYGLRVKA